jgi:tetratricopeptide (TPR) repeat protein
VALDRVLEFERSGKFNEALKHIDLLNESEQNQGLFVKARILKNIGIYDESVSIINAISNQLDKTQHEISGLTKVEIRLLKAELLLHTGNLDEGLQLIHSIEKDDDLIEQCSKQEKELLQGKILVLKGIVDEKRSKLKQAMGHLQNALKIFEKQKIKPHIADTYHFIGLLHERMGNFETSLTLYRKSLDIRREYNNQHEIATSLKQIGTLWGKKGNLDLASNFFKESLSIRQSMGENKYEISKLHINLGIVNRLKGKLKEALVEFNQSLSLSEEINNEENISLALTNIASIQFDSGSLDEALSTYTNS